MTSSECHVKVISQRNAGPLTSLRLIGFRRLLLQHDVLFHRKCVSFLKLCVYPYILKSLATSQRRLPEVGPTLILYDLGVTSVKYLSHEPGITSVRYLSSCSYECHDAPFDPSPTPPVLIRRD